MLCHSHQFHSLSKQFITACSWSGNITEMECAKSPDKGLARADRSAPAPELSGAHSYLIPT